jgi:hypothetical protein
MVIQDAREASGSGAERRLVHDGEGPLDGRFAASADVGAEAPIGGSLQSPVR